MTRSEREALLGWADRHGRFTPEDITAILATAGLSLWSWLDAIEASPQPVAPTDAAALIGWIRGQEVSA